MADKTKDEVGAVGVGSVEVTESGEVVAKDDLTDGQLVALRTTDTDKKSTPRYVKVFVHGPGPKPIPENGIDYAASEAATRQYAIQNGLRPTGDVKLDGIEQNRDGVSWDLTFSVAVTPTERVDGPSEAFIVTNDEDVPANTDGAGHSGDTRGKLTR